MPRVSRKLVAEIADNGQEVGGHRLSTEVFWHRGIVLEFCEQALVSFLSDVLSSEHGGRPVGNHAISIPVCLGISGLDKRLQVRIRMQCRHCITSLLYGKS